MASPSKRHETPRRLPRKRRRRRIAGFWLRLSGVALAGIAAGFLLFPVASKVVRPYRLGSDIDARIAELQAKIDQQTRINDDLQRHADYLQTDEGKEAVARSLGFHRPGEIVYLQQPESR